MRVSFGRAIFCNRAARLQLFFLGACAVYLPLSLVFPLWVAVLGQAIWGVPHLISSMRYTQRVPRANWTSFFVLIWTLVFAYRLVEHFGLWSHEPVIPIFEAELISLLASLVIFAWMNRRPTTETLAGLALLTALLICAWIIPLKLAAFLLLFHNVVAFIYWIASAQKSRERLVAVLSTGAFLVISAMILWGHFEWIYAWITPQSFSTTLHLGVAELGGALAPWSDSPVVWYRFFAAYVFGQSLHYFIWLKAIPEQNQNTETPESFRVAYRRLKQAFQEKVLVALLVLGFGFTSVWFLLDIPEARMIYFYLAAYHGFHELAGLAFLKSSGAHPHA